jgi:hypothetical protein
MNRRYAAAVGAACAVAFAAVPVVAVAAGIVNTFTQFRPPCFAA